MKNTKSSAKNETHPEVPEASVPHPDDQYYGTEAFPNDVDAMRASMQRRLYGNPAPANSVKVNPYDTSLLGSGIPNYVIDPSSLENQEFPPLDDPDTLEVLKEAARLDDARKQSIQGVNVFHDGVGTIAGYDLEAAWIQTYSGRRFCPTKPNPDAIVIQDIAHSLSMQCRFTGHTKKFYSVAQHSVYVSHICNEEDALWGLLHDASEAYLIDVPRPLKRSGHFQAYLEFEARMQEAICKRFGLPYEEPPSVKKADTKLLVTEARDLMGPLHKDWVQRATPLPFKIEAWDQQKAKDMFMQRFYELIGADPSNYEHYLRNKDVL